MSCTPDAGVPPRVLIVHNAYRQRGGEDSVVDAEEALLLQHGHAVHRYERSNAHIASGGNLQLAREALWSHQTEADVARLVQDFRPDVVHVHNTVPLISPAVYWAVRRAGLPVVQTLHNFRLICPQAMLLRDGAVCEDCVGRVPWRAVVHRCYRGSATQSAVVAGMLQTHRMLGTWRDKVTLYVALNEFCKAKFIEGGLPAERLRVKPNFVDLPALPPAAGARSGFLFAGRLAQEKGIRVLAQALQTAPAHVLVRVAGEGDEQAHLQSQPGAQMLGPLPAAQLYAEMRNALALVLPSIWYENFPRTLVEAFANGLPVIASRLGALATLVEDGRNGLLFEPGNAADLARVLGWAADHPQEMARMGAAARQQYECQFSATVNYRTLASIYNEAVLATLAPTG